MRWLAGGVLGSVLSLAAVAEAKVNDSDRDQSPLHRMCWEIQEAASWEQRAFDLSGGWGEAIGHLIELAFLGAAWDDHCASTFGSMTREAPAEVPTCHDADGDFLFDEDELAFGLDLASPDTDRDGLVDDLDPSWLADLLTRGGQARLAATADVAEEAVLAGDLAGAAALLADVQGALGCDAEPAADDAEVCLGAQALAVHLDLR